MNRFLISAGLLLCLVSSLRADEFPTPYDSEKDLSLPRMSAEEAAAKFRVREGFHVSVFASEPMVSNPIAAAWDTRGRLWIAENYTYAERPKKFELELRDRVLIFTDQDNDGHADPPTVFLDNAQRLTSIEVGLGGVWLMCPPQLLFVPDRDGDDKPDGPAEAVLEGFTVPPENFHNFANGLKWGPDGWLYGRCGASAPGQIRRADAPTAYEVPLRGGIWRFHPKTKQFEALCHGTTNPWGHDWDQYGECFFINTVNGHLWHMIPGAHYRRPHTINANPLVYEPIEMHADHWHWDNGQDWTDSRKATGEHDLRGGGHAHVGMMIYLGENWPEEYRGRLMTLNQHGRRMNVDRLEREGSGYVGRHEPDILNAADPWFRGVEVTYGPDGGVYILDWSDTGECHEATGVHRTSGRIYKVTYGDPKPFTQQDLTKAPLVKLVQLVQYGDEWHSRAARRELAARALDKNVSAAMRELRESITLDAEALPLLRSLWAWNTIEAYREPLNTLDIRLLVSLFKHPDEHVRSWAVRLWLDQIPQDSPLGEVRVPPAAIDGPLLNLAVDDRSGLVRLVLASALQRSDPRGRLLLASQLLSHARDADDHNLPYVIWYGLIPVAEKQPEALIPLAVTARIPKVRQWIARRCGELAGKQPELLNQLFEQSLTKAVDVREDIALGAAVGLEGQRKVAAPASWPQFFASFGSSAPDALRTLGVVFGDGRAMDEVRTLIFNDKADLQQRRNALQSYIEAEPADLREVCQRLLKTRFVNTIALQGLAKFDDPAIGRELAKSFKSFHYSERAAVIETLVSRPSFAAELLDEMAKGNIARTDVSAAQARQIRSFNDDRLTRKLFDAWGEFRDSPQEKQILIDKLKVQLPANRQADARNGRAIFQKNCANCHKLFGSGGEIGPDLTGANRNNLDYLLGNIVDPSAVVTKDFLMTVFAMTDGRVINGIITTENETTVTVQTAQAKQVLLKADIDERQQSKQSLMPDNLLQTLSPGDIADLFAYLQGDTQQPLPVESGTSSAPQ